MPIPAPPDTVPDAPDSIRRQESTMPELERPPVRTEVRAQELYRVLRSTWRTVVGTEPSRASLLVLLAQWAHETGGGQSSIAWNLAGIKYQPGCGHDYACYSTQERINSALVTIRPPDPGCRFRAYASLEDGAADYLAVLRTRFGFAWPAVEAGNAADFAHRLKLRGYYTDSEQVYAAGLARWYRQLDAVLGEDTDPDSPIAIARHVPDFTPTDPSDLPPAA